MDRVLAAFSLTALSLMAACGGGNPTAPVGGSRTDCAVYGDIVDLSAEPAYSANYLHRWETRDGCSVRLDIIIRRQGSDACGGELVADILMGWPLGEPLARGRPNRIYVRDPLGIIADNETSEAFQASAELPGEAVDTGYREGGHALWMHPGDDSFIYLVTGARVEAWPKDPDPAGCL